MGPMKAPFRFHFKLADASQKQMIQAWIAQEHIHEWLHGKGLRNTLEDLEKFFQGSSWAKHWIAYDGQTPFAYLLTSEKGKDAITLDLFICDLNYLGRGLGVQLIQEFVLSQFSNKKEVLIDPEATNTRAIHVYTKAGFETTGKFIASWHPVPHLQMRLKTELLLKKMKG
ncbi:MAG: GNAT family N-acetyltransferase [Verrucomicrobia bacterium]|nr:GNAT family N-acetyltransferase [Verrucomicrobiota bacterium]